MSVLVTLKAAVHLTAAWRCQWANWQLAVSSQIYREAAFYASHPLVDEPIIITDKLTRYLAIRFGV